MPTLEALRVAAATPDHGIMPGVPDAVYRKWAFASRSQLESMRRSAAHFWHDLNNPREATDELTFGAAFHTLILEPTQWDKRVVIVPEDAPEKRSKADKEWWAVFNQNNIDKLIIDREEYEQMTAMRDAIKWHKTAWLLLAGVPAAGSATVAHSELTVVWPHPAGVTCKSRLDRYVRSMGDVTITDLKSCRNAHPAVFSKDAEGYGYFREMGFYRQAISIMEGIPEEDIRCHIVAVEKDPPHGVIFYDMPHEDLCIGRDQMAEAVARFAACLESGEFPGYPQELKTLTLPAWAKKGQSDE